MVSNKLSVNPSKMEYLLFNCKYFNKPNCNINIDSYCISPNDSAKNFSAVFSSDMGKRVSAIIKSCFLQLCTLHLIRSFISKSAATTLANAFIHFHLDYCNILLMVFLNTQIIVYTKYKTQSLI